MAIHKRLGTLTAWDDPYLVKVRYLESSMLKKASMHRLKYKLAPITMLEKSNKSYKSATAI